MLSHGRIVHIVHRPLIDLIGARRDVAQKASSSHHSGKIRHTVAGLLHFLQDQLQTVAGLLIHMMERSQILLAVQQRASPFLLLFLEYGQLGGGGPGIDDQNVHMFTSCSVLRNIVLIFIFLGYSFPPLLSRAGAVSFGKKWITHPPFCPFSPLQTAFAVIK